MKLLCHILDFCGFVIQSGVQNRALVVTSIINYDLIQNVRFSIFECRLQKVFAFVDWYLHFQIGICISRSVFEMRTNEIILYKKSMARVSCRIINSFKNRCLNHMHGQQTVHTICVSFYNLMGFLSRIRVVHMNEFSHDAAGI